MSWFPLYTLTYDTYKHDGMTNILWTKNVKALHIILGYTRRFTYTYQQFE